jgi:hypothetical protein
MVSGGACEAIERAGKWNFEKGQKSPHSNSVAAMRQAIEAAGIQLLFESSGIAAGIRSQGANPNRSGDAFT